MQYREGLAKVSRTGSRNRSSAARPAQRFYLAVVL